MKGRSWRIGSSGTRGGGAEGRMGGWADGPMGRWAIGLPEREGPHGSIQSPGQPTGFLTSFIELTPFRGLDQVEVLDELENVGEFGKRTDGDVEEAAKLPWALLCRSFGDVCRHRKSSSSSLGCESVAFVAREALCCTIRGEDQLVSGLPGLEALIALHKGIIRNSVKPQSTAHRPISPSAHPPYRFTRARPTSLSSTLAPSRCITRSGFIM
jgi:hypothetical protein